MDNEELVAICKHELRLEEDHDIARLIQEVKRLQDDSSDTYARLTKQHRIKAREILSGYVLAWEYVEDLDGSRLWNRKLCRPDALLWPEDKKKYCMMTSFRVNMLTYAGILAGVEKLFNELQDYWIIDRQKRMSRQAPKDFKKTGAGVDPSPSIAQSTIRPPTERSGRRDKYPKTGVAPVPDCAAPVAQETELNERASGQKEKPKRAVSTEFYDADPNAQLGGTGDEEFTEVSRCRNRALTPPYIPEKGSHQTWPGFGFKNVSEEGVRALRKRTVNMEHSEEPPTIPCRSKELMGASIEKCSSTVPAQSSEEGCVDEQGLKRALKGRLHNVPNSLPTRLQAASTTASDIRSLTSEEDSAICKASLLPIPNRGSLAVQATAVQRSQKPSNDTGNSQ